MSNWRQLATYSIDRGVSDIGGYYGGFTIHCAIIVIVWYRSLKLYMSMNMLKYGGM